ncbi:MAG: transcriptional regulator [Paenibacillaceae bacterium]
MNMTRDKTLRKGVFQHVEAEIFAYPYRKREIARLREELLTPYQVVDSNVGGGKGNLPGDPTGKKAITLASNAKLHNLERVADAIDEVYNRLPAVKQEFIRVKYWTTPQRLTTIGICENLGISDRTFRRWRQQFIVAVAEILGW